MFYISEGYGRRRQQCRWILLLEWQCFLGPSGLVWVMGSTRWWEHGLLFCLLPSPVVAGFLSSPLGKTCISLLAFRMMLSSVNVRSGIRHIGEESRVIAAQSWILVHLQGTPAMLPFTSLKPVMMASTGICCLAQQAHLPVVGITKVLCAHWSGQTAQWGRATSVRTNVWHLLVPLPHKKWWRYKVTTDCLSTSVGSDIETLSRNDSSRKSVTWSKFTGLE